MAARGAVPDTDNEVWHRVTITAIKDDGIYAAVNRRSDNAEELGITRLGDFDTLSSLVVIDKRGNVNTVGAFDNFILKTPPAAGTPDKPSVTVTGDCDDDIKTVTLALADDAADGTTLSYSFDGETYTPYTEALKIQASTYVYAKATNGGIDSGVEQVYVAAGVIPTPSGEITCVNGTSRTVAFTSAYSLEYNTTGEDGEYSDYSEPISVSETTTFYVRAKKTSTVDSNVTLYSAIFTLAVTAGAGSEVTLATPTLVRCALTGLYINASQSGVTATPTPDIHYTVNGGAEQTIASASTATITIPDANGTTVAVWAECAGYTKSATATFTSLELPESHKVFYEIDYVAFFAEHGKTGSSWADKTTISHTHVASTGESNLPAGDTYYGIVNDGVDLYNPIWYADSNSGSNPRWGLMSGGLYQNNDRLNNKTVYPDILFAGMTAGDYIYVNTELAPSANQNVTLVKSGANEYLYRVNADGDCRLGLQRYISGNTYAYTHAIRLLTKKTGLLIIVR